MTQPATLSPSDLDLVLDQVIQLMRSDGMEFPQAIERFEKRWIEQLYAFTHGHQGQVSRLMHLHRNTLQRKEEKLHVDRRAFKREPRRRKSSAGEGKHETATAVHSVRKGGCGESLEPSGAAKRSFGAAPDETFPRQRWTA